MIITVVFFYSTDMDKQKMGAGFSVIKSEL